MSTSAVAIFSDSPTREGSEKPCFRCIHFLPNHVVPDHPACSLFRRGEIDYVFGKEREYAFAEVVRAYRECGPFGIHWEEAPAVEKVGAFQRLKNLLKAKGLR